MSDGERLMTSPTADERPTARLCYAPPSNIPHPAHVWHGLPADTTAEADPIRLQSWFCDGWAAILPLLVARVPGKP